MILINCFFFKNDNMLGQMESLYGNISIFSFKSLNLKDLESLANGSNCLVFTFV